MAIYSLLSNASDEYTYNIRILHDGLCEADYSGVLDFSFLNANISFVDVAEYAKDQNYYDGVTEYTSHITKETFYRLLIPELFPNLDKVIYLDSDLIVLDDISKLVQIDLGDKTIGAVYSVEQWCEGNTGMLPNDDPHEWFNAGVMLFDIRQYIQNGYPQKVRDALSNTVFDVGDQELLRLICYKDVKYLPFEWNVMWHHLNNGGTGLKDYNRNIYYKAISNPKIVHYS